ncbi:VCBS repeat-containing protein [candidate division KSB1 bacterium]|nr:VCBS repeat-containing protein [candidate division KSB1 bacterium]
MKKEFKQLLVMILCLGLQFFIPFQNQNLTAGEIGRVNEDAGNLNQNYPVVATSTSGIYVVAWCEGLAPSFSIKAQLYNLAGNKIGNNFPVNDQVLGSVTPVDVDMANNGSFVITWTDFINGQIYAQQFTATGSRSGSVINVADEPAKAAVAATADGRFLVVHIHDGSYIKGHSYDANGQEKEIMMEIPSGSDIGYPEIDASSDGFFVFVWQKGIDENIIRSAYYDANKNEIGPMMTVHQQNLSGYRAFAPDVAVAEDHSYVIVWADGKAPYQIVGKRYDKNQNQIGDLIQISLNDCDVPAITMNRSGEVFIEWMESRNLNYDIYGQNFTADMISQGESIRINEDTGTATQRRPALCWGSGGIFHVWEDDRKPNQGFDLYAAITNLKKAQYIDVTTSTGIGDVGVCLGFAFGDFNRDENLDLYIYNNGTKKLFKNSGAPNFNFSDITTETGVGNDQQGNGTAFFDYNNDGYTDLLLLNNGAKVFLKNKGDGTFTDVTVATNLTDVNNSVGCAIGDYNNDGFLDIYLANYNAINRLFKNSGPPDWKFTDVAGSAGVNATYDAQACIFWDYDNDHDLDIYVSFYGAPNILYKNNGDGTFSEVGQAAGVNYGARCRGAIAFDYDNDGDLDLYVTRGRYQTNQLNVLYQNNGAPAWDFTNVTTSAGVGNVGDGSLSTVGDYDNDGDLDIYVANGSNHANPQNALYQNNSDGTFTEIATQEGVVNPLACSAASFVDYNNDGFLDLYAGNTEGANTLYKNQGNNAHWLKVNLIGKRGNYNAIGARITVTAGQKKQIRDVNGDNPGLHLFNNQPVHFGLGQATKVESIEINWPGGGTQFVLDQAVDQTITIMEYAYSAGTNQIKPAIALAPDGNYIVAWLDEKSQFCDVYAERFATNGEVTSPKFRVSNLSWNLSTSDIVDLTVTVDGSVIIIWSRQAQNKIYGQRYSCSGAVLGSNFIVAEGYSPKVEPTPDGGFIVVFTKGSWNYTLCTNKYDKNGVLQHSIIKPRGQYDNFCRPSIAVAKDGAVVIAYKNNKGDTYPGSAGDALSASYYNSVGNLISSVRIDDKPAGDHEQNLGSPTVEMADDGTFLVIWTGGGIDKIQGKRFDKDGNLLTRFDVADYIKLTSKPVIFMNEYDDFIVTWGDEKNSSKNIYARRYSGNHQPLTDVYQIDPIVQPAAQMEPDVLMTGQSVHLVWQDNRIPGNGWDIRSYLEKLPLVMMDDFNDNLLSNTDWQIITRPNTSVAEKSQHLEFRVDEYVEARVESKFRLRGDFDFAVNFNTRINSDGGNGLYISAFDATHNYAISRHYNAGWQTKDGKYGHMYLSNFDGDYTSGRLSTTADDTTGKLRVVRKGNQITSYFMRKGYWTELLTKIGTTTDLSVGLSISTYGGTKTLTGWLDNFIITKGEIYYPPSAIDENDFMNPAHFQLNQNFPNPFNPITQIKYHLPESGLVNLIIYNTLGQEVRTLVNEKQPAGIHQIYWNGNDNEGKIVVSGIYIYQISAGDFICQRKMVLLK